jgi:hypothetical protein
MDCTFWTEKAIDVLGLVLSWPVAVLAICALFSYRHGGAINTLISRLRIKYGDLEASPVDSQVAKNESAGIPPPANTTLPATPVPAEGEAAQHVCEYRFRYLELLLALHTKSVLYEAVRKPTIAELQPLMTKAIPSPFEQSSVLGALQSEDLAAVRDGRIVPTDLGVEYMAWRAKRGSAPPPELTAYALAGGFGPRNLAAPTSIPESVWRDLIAGRKPTSSYYHDKDRPGG